MGGIRRHLTFASVTVTIAGLAMAGTALGLGQLARQGRIRPGGSVSDAQGKNHRTSSRIAFERFDPHIGKSRIYTIRPDHTGLHAITKPPANADEDGDPPAWSPNGRRIVFRRIYNDGRPDALIRVNRNGGHPHDITKTNCTGNCLGSAEPAWSPNGKRIAFSRWLGPPPPNGPPPIVGIFVMRANGSHLHQLTQLTPNSGTEDHSPTWSPNSKRIAFMRSNNTKQPENASSIFVMDANGGDLHRIRRMPKKWPGAGVPEWSPNGRRILFGTYCLFGFCGQPQTGAQLFKIRPNGNHLRRLTHLPGNSYDPAWSPSGRRIVFSRNPKVCCPPTGELYVMRRDGTHVRRLTHAPRLDNHNPGWGPSPRKALEAAGLRE
jgi:TolB protein